MEEKLNGEQPEEILENVQSGIVEKEENGTTCLNETGSLGKFKDTESLLKAYNNLQAEFTKKCQKLSELMKKEGGENLEEINEQTCIKEVKNEDENNVSENVATAQIFTSEQNVPVYKSEEWNKKVALFLEHNDEAKEFASEISEEILQDEKLQNSENALELAWARVMQKEYAQPKKLAQDQNFIREQILSQDQIKWLVLNEYFKDIQTKKVPPLITTSGVVAGTTTFMPKNMTEAKEAVQKLFNIKGN